MENVPFSIFSRSTSMRPATPPSHAAASLAPVVAYRPEASCPGEVPCHQGHDANQVPAADGEEMLVALMMEGKFSGEGIHSLESDDDMMSAMARELVERGRVSESADAVWADLKRERAQHMPSTPRVSQTELVAEDDPLLPLLSQVPVAPSSPALHLVEPNPKTQQKPSTLWPTGHTEGEQMLLFA
jgi:hypothetical protein